MLTFWAISRNIIFEANWCGYFLGKKTIWSMIDPFEFKLVMTTLRPFIELTNYVFIDLWFLHQIISYGSSAINPLLFFTTTRFDPIPIGSSFLRVKVNDHQCDQKKLPNVYKSSPKMISLENCPKRGQFGQINCCHRLWKVAKSAINCPIWSHCQRYQSSVLQKVSVIKLSKLGRCKVGR